MILRAFLFLSTCCSVEAVQASPHAFQHHQPDDTLSPPLYVRGNHKFHIITDVNGFTVVDDEGGWKVYATLNETSGRLRPTSLKVGLDDPVKALEAGLLRGKMEMPDLQVQLDTCGKFCRHVDAFNKSSSNTTDYHRSIQEIGDDDVQRKTTTKNRKNLVVLMRFADHQDRILPSTDAISVMMNKIGGDETFAPTGSVRDVFLQNSYGNFDVISTVHPWFNLPFSESYYADKASGATLVFESALHVALDNLDNDQSISLSDFDTDGDGTVDAVMFLHSGYGAEWGDNDCNGQAFTDRIWTHQWSLEKEWVSKKSGLKLSRYHTSSALWWTCGQDISRIGTLAHELGHTLGLPYLNSMDVTMGGSGIGSFGLMGNLWGFDGSQRFPPMMSPWSKIRLGWIEPTEIKISGTYEIEASALEPDIYIISSPFPSGEYILIENRQPAKFDALLPQGGLIIWHIDSAVSFEDSPGYPGQLNWPENGKHYHVAVLQADGRYDLERGGNVGDSTDVWHALSRRRSLEPSLARPGIYPNTNSYQGGIIKSTGIILSDISPSNKKMSFRVTLPILNSVTPTSSPRSVDSGTTGKLATLMDGGNGSFGVMFEIRSTSVYPITVRSLSFHTSLTVDVGVEAYTKTGGHLQAPESQWTRVANTQVSGKGHKQQTHIPNTYFNNVRILPGTRQSFFIMLNSADMRYSNMPMEKFLTPYTSNSYFEILTGSGVGQHKFKQLFPDRMFNGEVHFSLETGKAAGSSSVIETTYEQNNSSYGSMFDVKVLKSVILTGMDIHTKWVGTIPVEIWTKKGSHKSFEQRRDVWTKIIATNANGQGIKKPTTVEFGDTARLEMYEGESRAFYVVLETIGLLYTTGDYPAMDDNLQIFAGTGVSYLFGNSYYPRSWNGGLHYSTVEDTTLMETSTLMTTYQGGNGSFGCMFDVHAHNDIIIKSLDIHTRLGKDSGGTWIIVYSQKGQHTLNIQNWGEPIFNQKVVGQGSPRETSLPSEHFKPVSVLKGEIQAFYVTMRTADLRYTNGQSLGRFYSSNSDLSITEGTGIASFLISDRKAVLSPRVFNGIVHYEKAHVGSSSSPTAAEPFPIVQITTGMQGQVRSFGNIFDVKAKRNLKITSMNIHTSSTDSVLVEVWTRQGSYMMNSDNLDGWDRIAEGFVEGNGQGVATIIPQNLFTTGVEMSAGDTRAFYVTLRLSLMRYSKLVVGTVIVEENLDLEIMPGYGVGRYPLRDALKYYPRAWNGSLLYR